MNLLIRKPILLICILFAFTAQTVAASVMLCSMNHQSVNIETAHSHHEMMAITASDDTQADCHQTMAVTSAQTSLSQATDDCCMADCTCLNSTCSSLSLVAGERLSPLANTAEQKFSPSAQALAKRTLDNLFRPPINA